MYNTPEEVDVMIEALQAARELFKARSTWRREHPGGFPPAKNPSWMTSTRHHPRHRNRHRGSLTDPSASHEGLNPLCGDEVTIDIAIKDGEIADIAYRGSGCSISQSSASMMTSPVEGKSVGEARALIGSFTEMMRGSDEIDPEELDDLEAMAGVRKFPVRVKCATARVRWVKRWTKLRQPVPDPRTGRGVLDDNGDLALLHTLSREGCAMKAIILTILAVTVLSWRSGRASAITCRRLDGNGHPNVGALIAEFREPGQKDILCSGTLISPTVYLTASHCTIYLESLEITDVWVTFDPQFDNSSSPAGLTTNRRTATTWPGLTTLRLWCWMPRSRGNRAAQLPTGASGRAKRGKRALARSSPQRYRDQERQNGGPPVFPFDGARHVGESEFRTISGNWLRLSQNPSLGGGALLAFGGPNFLGSSNIVVAVTVTGDTACRSTNVDFRLDVPGARDFLDDYVTLP